MSEKINNETMTDKLSKKVKEQQFELERYKVAVEEIKYYVDECLSCGDEMNPWKVDEVLERLEREAITV